MIEFIILEYNLNLQSCFNRTEAERDDRYDIEQIKSIILSIYDVPVSFQSNSQLEGKSLLQMIVENCLSNLFFCNSSRSLPG